MSQRRLEPQHRKRWVAMMKAGGQREQGVEAELSGAVHFNGGTMSSVVRRGWRRQNGGRYSGDH